MVTIGNGLGGPSGSRTGALPLPVDGTTASVPSRADDTESRDWVLYLRAEGDVREEALARLHALLLRAARFEVDRRRTTLEHLRGDELDDIASQAADEALMSVLSGLDQFRGRSSFTTWAAKFALLEAAVKMRLRAWQGREVQIAPETWPRLSERLEPAGEAQHAQLSLLQSIAETLTPDERLVVAALALDGVPIDVLAERLHTTRGALYKTLQDARRKFRRHVADTGLVKRPAAQAVGQSGSR